MAGNNKGQKRRTTRKEYQRLSNKFEMEGFMAQKGLWNLVREKVLRERGELPKEVGRKMPEQLVKERWDRERRNNIGNGQGEQIRKGEKRKRKGEKEENETETVNRRCEGSASVDAFEIFNQGRDLESYGNLSW